MLKTWIIIYRHRHGDDFWPLYQANMPDPDKIAAGLDDFEEDRGESIEIAGPFDLPAS
jgi:hypothetical protein